MMIWWSSYEWSSHDNRNFSASSLGQQNQQTGGEEVGCSNSPASCLLISKKMSQVLWDTDHNRRTQPSRLQLDILSSLSWSVNQLLYTSVVNYSSLVKTASWKKDADLENHVVNEYVSRCLPWSAGMGWHTFCISLCIDFQALGCPSVEDQVNCLLV